MLRPWEKVNSRPAGDFRIFKIRADKIISPRTQEEHEFYVLDCPNWVNVIATTPEGQIVLIEQYRHGSNTIELEIPGGMIDPEDASPEAAAVRELREETGYEGGVPQRIGEVFPNPAIMSNTCYTVLIEDCRCVHPVQFDHSEDLVTKLAPVGEIPELIASGKIRHSLVVVGLGFYLTRMAARGLK